MLRNDEHLRLTDNAPCTAEVDIDIIQSNSALRNDIVNCHNRGNFVPWHNDGQTFHFSHNPHSTCLNNTLPAQHNTHSQRTQPASLVYRRSNQYRNLTYFLGQNISIFTRFKKHWSISIMQWWRNNEPSAVRDGHIERWTKHAVSIENRLRGFNSWN